MLQYSTVSPCINAVSDFFIRVLSPFIVPIAICILPIPPLNGTLLTNSQNTDQTESSVITFQCDLGFSLVGTETATCNNSGLWDPDPALLECKFTKITGARNFAALSGGFVALVVVLILLVAIFLLVANAKKKKSKAT